MTIPVQRGRLALLALAGIWLAGCAQPPRQAREAAAAQHWSGRLALQVDQEDAQSFSAAFILSGTSEAGRLQLFSPLGSTLAELQWQAGLARLTTGSEQRESGSLAQLAQELTGAELPIEALFAWLRGEAVQSAGWQADLSRLADGRLVATRQQPAPQATLRIVLER